MGSIGRLNATPVRSAAGSLRQADVRLHMQRLGRMVVERVRSGLACEIALGGHQVCYKLCSSSYM